jgi:hypothetical protein
MSSFKADECKIIEFPLINDHRGNLLFVEGKRHVPFEIKRVYYLCDVPSGATRGGHAHVKMESVIVALSGSFNVNIDDGFKKKSFFLNRPHYGLYLPSRIWRGIYKFLSNSIALFFSSKLLSENDYIRQYKAFKRIARNDIRKS